jgi:hypothetical protein
MQPIQNRKDIQKLIGRIASLNQFISKLAEQSLPFFTILRGSAKIDWGTQQQQAFNDLKNYLEHLPTLSSPEQEHPLILYISATHSAVPGALVVEKEVAHKDKTMKQQLPMYFVSEVLTGSKKFYSEKKKNLLHNIHECMKALTLLRSTCSQSLNKSAVGRYLHKQR